MSGARGDYRSYLLRLYRVQKASWRASLLVPPGGEPLHFASLSELVAFLEQEGDRANGAGEQDAAEETTVDEEGDMDD